MTTKTIVTRTQTTTTKPIKLNRDIRKGLVNTAHHLVGQWKTAALEDLKKQSRKARDKWAKEFASLICAAFPQREMQKLAEYGVAKKLPDAQLNLIVSPEGEANHFVYLHTSRWTVQSPLASVLVPTCDFTDFSDIAKQRLRARAGLEVHDSDTLHSPWTRKLLEDPSFKLAYGQESEIHAEANRRIQAYVQLIEQSTTFEQIVDVWPEVAPLAARFRGEAPPVLLPEAIRRTIETDIAERKRARIPALTGPAPSAQGVLSAAAE